MVWRWVTYFAFLVIFVWSLVAWFDRPLLWTTVGVAWGAIVGPTVHFTEPDSNEPPRRLRR